MQDIKVGVARTRFRCSPAQRVQRPRRSIHTDDDSASSHGRRASHDRDRAGRLLRDAIAHRAEQQTFESATTASTHYQQVGAVARLEERPGRKVADDALLRGHIRAKLTVDQSAKPGSTDEVMR